MDALELEKIRHDFAGLELQNRMMEKKYSDVMAELSKCQEAVSQLSQVITEMQSSMGVTVHTDSDGLRLLSGLTPRQHVLLQLFIEGFNYDQMGNRVGVSINTIKTQAKAVRTKWGVDNRADLIFKARRAMSSVADALYVELSGGLPKDWGEKYAHARRDEDPFNALYKPSKGRGVEHDE